MLKFTNICCQGAAIAILSVGVSSTSTRASTIALNDVDSTDTVFSSDTSVVDSATPGQTVPIPLTSDTTLYIPSWDNSSAKSVTNATNFEKHLTQLPTVALFKSMIVPGLGQIGNRRYLKAAIAIGLESYFFSRVLEFGNEASDARRAWQEETDLVLKRNLYIEFDDKRSDRNKFIWFTGIITFLSMFDAYVDAHLSGSPSESRNDRVEESDKVSMTLVPEVNNGIRFSLRLKF